jgi:hypothetical protein
MLRTVAEDAQPRCAVTGAIAAAGFIKAKRESFVLPPIAAAASDGARLRAQPSGRLSGDCHENRYWTHLVVRWRLC